MPPLGNNGSKGESRDEEKNKSTFDYKRDDNCWMDGGAGEFDDPCSR